MQIRKGGKNNFHGENFYYIFVHMCDIFRDEEIRNLSHAFRSEQRGLVEVGYLCLKKSLTS